eukprot:m.335432 g.335432  ORF g.335432 m.335432 type:complete len:414 (-) comp17592_c0_seq1:34-1275(-)
MATRQVATVARRCLSSSSRIQAVSAPEFPAKTQRPKRVVNLSAGCAALPEEVLNRAAKEMNAPMGKPISVTEMGYRTDDFYEMMENAENSFRTLMNVPDTHEIHFFNGGATLQFAAIPFNLLPDNGRDRKGGVPTYVMSGHWSEKAYNEARLISEPRQANVDPSGLYFTIPEKLDIPADSTYVHYTSADTRQGLEFQDFPYDQVPEGVLLCCDASANLGSKPVDVSKYDVLYAAAHKNFSTSGVCYTMIRKNLINDDNHPHTPTMCNWNKFSTAPGKIYNVPVTFSVWLGHLVCEHMIDQGGLPYYEDLAIRRSNLLYNLIDDSNGYYRTFVNEDKFRSRMQVVFTIRDGEGKNSELVEKFLAETANMGWLDVRSHPLGISSDAIRITMYNPQPIEVIEYIRDYMHYFQQQNP